MPEFGVPGPWSVGVSEGGGGRLIKVGVFIFEDCVRNGESYGVGLMHSSR